MNPALPDGIGPHEQQELALMLAGKKHVALFSDFIPADFLPYLQQGVFQLQTAFCTVHEGMAFPSFVIFAPSHRQQAETLIGLITQPRRFDAETERRIGRILGYEAWQIEAFIQHFQRETPP